MSRSLVNGRLNGLQTDDPVRSSECMGGGKWIATNMNGRFLVSGDARRFPNFHAARAAAQAASRRQPTAVELMWCDNTWRPKVCLGHATAGVWLATGEGRAWAFRTLDAFSW